jgi:hypothetical protein
MRSIPPMEMHRRLDGIRREVICMYLCVTGGMIPFIWPLWWSIWVTPPTRAWSFFMQEVMCHQHFLVFNEKPICFLLFIIMNDAYLIHCDWDWSGAMECAVSSPAPYVDLFPSCTKKIVYFQGKMLRYHPIQEASSVPCSISKKKPKGLRKLIYCQQIQNCCFI